MMRAALLATLGACTVAASAAHAQSVRVNGSSSIRYIELRPLVRDSVPAGAAAGDGLLRQLADGRIVRCIPGDAFCRDVRPGDVVATVPVLHDLEVSAWGFGEGVRLFTHVRGRTAWGGRELWPRADEQLELVAAYAEIDRARWRVRAGRQWKVSGLGFYNFDGLAAAVRPFEGAAIEAYAGRSLVRGLNEPRTGGALEAVEALAPPSPGLLLGAQLRYRPTPRLAVSATYQIDFRDDGHGIHSEVAVADGVLRVGRGTVEGSVEIDVAGEAMNEARLFIRSAPIGAIALHAELRRYRPSFELWTIWGAFSPVGYEEVRAGATWAGVAGRVLVRAEGMYRSYDAVADASSPDEYRDHGRGASAGVSWAPYAAWRVEGGYRIESSFGAARRDAHAAITRQLGDVGSIALHGVAFQRVYEFRLSEGTVLGAGADASLRLSGRARVLASAAAYRHNGGGGAGIDWSQRRASLRLQWTVGAEPGMGGAP